MRDFALPGAGQADEAAALALYRARCSYYDWQLAPYEALRRAGLYHIISISGLHMALVAGVYGGMLLNRYTRSLVMLAVQEDRPFAPFKYAVAQGLNVGIDDVEELARANVAGHLQIGAIQTGSSKKAAGNKKGGAA
mgnify:CR=1 FL=1